jgi:hypothetical protein
MKSISEPIIKLKPWWLAWAWWAKNASITIYPYIYASKLPPEAVTLAHEFVHFEQQRKAKSRTLWFLKYIFNPGFRKQVELEAFASTIRYYINHNQMTVGMKEWLANELSGATYFFMMRRQEAKKWIEDTVSRIRKEKNADI